MVRQALPLADVDLIEGHCQRIIDEKEKLAFDWAGDAKEAREERSFRIIQGHPTRIWPDIAEQAYRKWLVASSVLRSCASSARLLVRPVPRQASREERAHLLAPGRGLLGPQPGRQGDHLLDPAAGRRRRQRLHAFHRRRASGRGADPPAGRRGAERPADLRRRRGARRGLSDRPRRRHLPPLQDPAHDHRQHLGPLSQGDHQSPAARRPGRRRRPLPLEDLCEPAHRRTHRSSRSR